MAFGLSLCIGRTFSPTRTHVLPPPARALAHTKRPHALRCRVAKSLTALMHAHARTRARGQSVPVRWCRAAQHWPMTTAGGLAEGRPRPSRFPVRRADRLPHRRGQRRPAQPRRGPSLLCESHHRLHSAPPRSLLTYYCSPSCALLSGGCERVCIACLPMPWPRSAQVVKTSCHHCYPAQLQALLAFSAASAADAHGDEQVQPASHGPPARRQQRCRSVALSFEDRDSSRDLSRQLSAAQEAYDSGSPSSPDCSQEAAELGDENRGSLLAHATVRSNQVMPQPAEPGGGHARLTCAPSAAPGLASMESRADLARSASSPRIDL